MAGLGLLQRLFPRRLAVRQAALDTDGSQVRVTIYQASFTKQSNGAYEMSVGYKMDAANLRTTCKGDTSWDEQLQWVHADGTGAGVSGVSRRTMPAKFNGVENFGIFTGGIFNDPAGLQFKVKVFVANFRVASCATDVQAYSNEVTVTIPGTPTNQGGGAGSYNSVSDQAPNLDDRNPPPPADTTSPPAPPGPPDTPPDTPPPADSGGFPWKFPVLAYIGNLLNGGKA